MKLKAAYFDCFAGASGDMLIGSLLDAGVDFIKFKNQLAKLKIGGYELKAEKKTSRGITGTKFTVIVTEKHTHRGLHDIIDIIEASGLSKPVRACSIGVFKQLAEAEGKIHNMKPEEIHFHEVGAVDSIIDITGFFIALKMLNIINVFASKLHVGTGSFECAHGRLPLPAPATLELIKGIPTYCTGIEKELLTPTGAALLTATAETFGPIPDLSVNLVGYGIGTHELDIANIVRVTIGQREEKPEKDPIHLLETNIDDMNPQYYNHIMELLFEAGAKDVFLVPVIMKKNRPGVILSVLTNSGLIDDMSEIIFRETTTLGLRISEEKKRLTLSREFIFVKTQWGKIKTKVRILSDYSKSAFPEFDECRTAALKHNVPVQRIYNETKKLAEAIFAENGKQIV